MVPRGFDTDYVAPGNVLDEMRCNRCGELRSELLTACIETHTYRDLYQRCMELIERYEPKQSPAEPHVEGKE